MGKKIAKFLSKKIFRSSLKVYIISNMIMMVLSILLVLELVSWYISSKLEKLVMDSYTSKYGSISEEELHNYINNMTFKEIENLGLGEWYESTNSFFTWVIYAIVIAAGVIFGTILVKRLLRELHIFENALETISNESIIGGNIDEIGSDIREFNSICISYNRMAKRLKDSEEQRRQMEMAQKKMIADISHDIKTPITVIQGYSQAVCDELVDDATKKKYLDIICKKADTVAELTNTLHEYSKLEHPDFAIDLKEGDVCEYFRVYLAAKYQELDVAGYELEADIPDKKIMYRFDKNQLKRVFENLITNSFRHNDKGIMIYAEMKDDDDNIIIRIGDTGKGIPQELRSTIFQPFVVGNKSRTGAKGSGLGLAISRKIVEEHGGIIRLSEDPEGRLNTLYEIILPKHRELYV